MTRDELEAIVWKHAGYVAGGPDPGDAMETILLAADRYADTRDGPGLRRRDGTIDHYRPATATTGANA